MENLTRIQSKVWCSVFVSLFIFVECKGLCFILVFLVSQVLEIFDSIDSWAEWHKTSQASQVKESLIKTLVCVSSFDLAPILWEPETTYPAKQFVIKKDIQTSYKWEVNKVAEVDEQTWPLETVGGTFQLEICLLMKKNSKKIEKKH